MPSFDPRAGLAIYQVPGDLYDLLNFGPNRIFITDAQGSFVVSGLIMGDFTLGGSSSWSMPTGSGGAAFDMLNNALAAGVGIGNFAASQAGFGGVTKPQVKSPYQTVVDWTGSSEFELGMDIMFIALTPDDDVRIPVFNLLRCVYPEMNDSGTLIIPPLQYARVPGSMMYEGSADIWGCVAIKIGSWFETPANFVVKSANFSMSKQQIPPTLNRPFGAPLYAKGRVEVKCSHMVGVEQLARWILPEGSDPFAL